MTSSHIQIGHLVSQDSDHNSTQRAISRERTERRLGLLLLSFVGFLTLAAFSAGTNLSMPRSEAVIESKTFSQLFDVSQGVRRL